MSSPCSTCHTRCCWHYTVATTGYDMWIISTGLRLAPEQFVVALREKKATPTGFVLDASGQTYQIALDKGRADSHTNSGERPCVFWLGLPGSGRCGIYPMRPLVCQVFPAYMEGGEVKRREDAVCPTEAWRGDELQHPAWRDRLFRMQLEIDIYQLAVERWNRHVLSNVREGQLPLVAYYAFLMTYYDRLQEVRSRLDNQGWGELGKWWADTARANIESWSLDSARLGEWADFVHGVLRAVEGLFSGGREQGNEAVLAGLSDATPVAG